MTKEEFVAKLALGAKVTKTQADAMFFYVCGYGRSFNQEGERVAPSRTRGLLPSAEEGTDRTGIPLPVPRSE